MIAILIIVAAFALCLYAAATDVKRLEIDNWVPVAIAALFVVYGLLTPVIWGAHIAVMLVMLLVGLGVHKAGWMGGGDIKMLVALSLWAGIQGLPALLLATSMAGAVVALTTVALGRRKVFSQATGLAWIDGASAEHPHVAYGIAIAIGAAVLFMQIGG